MKQYNQLSPEEKVMRWQYGAVALMFVLFFPTAILSLYIFNGSIKYIFLPLSIPLLFIGVSSIKNQVSIFRSKGKKEPARGKNAVGIGILMIVAVFVQLLFIFVLPLSNILFGFLGNGFNGFSQSNLDNLPIYNESEVSSQFYRATDSPDFTEINTYKNISAWGSYMAVPLALVNGMVLVVGNVSKEDTSGINSDLINADIATGKVNWQIVTGSGFIATDLNRVYVETENQPFGGATGIASYHINSGEKIWETTFDWKYAIGISNLTYANSGINVRTYHRGKGAFYVLDQDSGEITTFIDKDGFVFAIENGTTYEWFGSTVKASGQINWATHIEGAGFYDRDLAAPIILDELIIVKSGHSSSSPITAVRKNDGVIVWQFNQDVVSNVAVGGTTTYALTKQNELLALDTQTGKILGSLKFTPSFPKNFDFVNTSIFMAADGDTVVIYFENTRQLSVFRFVMQG
ncbi:MAG TPA: PQQ-binding-like beta-propeller repeat protein [Chloroflexota bacterium]|nr:PQQ-binding-like beta-propeller repeat protein [Chloroflexota bacterium]HUM69732.1 PQQ-binding-like beta-propeller repeat protein [Chloroflexota bacterium]